MPKSVRWSSGLQTTFVAVVLASIAIAAWPGSKKALAHPDTVPQIITREEKSELASSPTLPDSASIDRRLTRCRLWATAEDPEVLTLLDRVNAIVRSKPKEAAILLDHAIKRLSSPGTPSVDTDSVPRAVRRPQTTERVPCPEGSDGTAWLRAGYAPPLNEREYRALVGLLESTVYARKMTDADRRRLTAEILRKFGTTEKDYHHTRRYFMYHSVLKDDPPHRWQDPGITDLRWPVSGKRSR